MSGAQMGVWRVAGVATLDITSGELRAATSGAAELVMQLATTTGKRRRGRIRPRKCLAGIFGMTVMGTGLERGVGPRITMAEATCAACAGSSREARSPPPVCEQLEVVAREDTADVITENDRPSCDHRCRFRDGAPGRATAAQLRYRGASCARCASLPCRKMSSSSPGHAGRCRQLARR